MGRAACFRQNQYDTDGDKAYAVTICNAACAGGDQSHARAKSHAFK